MKIFAGEKAGYRERGFFDQLRLYIEVELEGGMGGVSIRKGRSHFGLGRTYNLQRQQNEDLKPFVQLGSLPAHFLGRLPGGLLLLRHTPRWRLGLRAGSGSRRGQVWVTSVVIDRSEEGLGQAG